MTQTSLLLKNDKVDSYFSTKSGYVLADMLANHIVRTEQLENIDEVICEFRQMIYNEIDKKYKVCVSALVQAEELNHINNTISNQRYFITIQED